MAFEITSQEENCVDKESGANTGPRLRRSLTLWDLILYGAIVLQPVAPMSAFGALSDRGRGHVVTAVLIAMVAMLCTAFSYGKMASVYPSAGSAFTYVAQEIHSSAGYITGWSMVMDYIVNPLICTIWCAGQAHEFAPGLPVWAWKIFFAVVFTLLNLQGIKTSARVNAGLAAAMSAVVVVVFVTTWAPAQRSGILHSAVLRPADLHGGQFVWMHVAGGAYLHWV
jgi:putrescine importer